MICAIHQPNLFPWLGYFAKIAKADSFVFLDAVQYPRSSRGCWSNRVKILTNGKPGWLTCPVNRPGIKLIQEVLMVDGKKWADKTIKTLKHSYGKTAHFTQVMDLLAPNFAPAPHNLADFNISCIQDISELLGLSCQFNRQSTFSNEEVFTNTGSKRLASICRELKATIYLAGDGAKGYEQSTAYMDLGMELANNQFRQKEYPQAVQGEFYPGLSILDALFNVGPGGTYKLLID